MTDATVPAGAAGAAPRGTTGRDRRRTLVLAAVVPALVAGAVFGWALRTVVSPGDRPPEARSYTLVAVEPGSVERRVPVNVTARWDRSEAGLNRAVGVVTTVAIDGTTPVDAGSVLYTVGLRPVVAAEGAVPAFRDLAQGAVGEDVSQLQHLLVATGQQLTPSGRFDGSTHRAVRAWQRSLGVADDGVVRLGDVVFLPDLPASLALGETLRPGQSAAGGEPIHRLAPQPTFEVAVGDDDRDLVPVATPIEIHHPGATWLATVTAVRDGGEGRVVASLGPSGDDASICNDRCDLIPLAGDSLVPAEAVLVPTTAGLVVPVAAMSSGPDGSVGVIRSTGEFVDVTVLATAGGMAVVDGLRVGDRVRAPAERAAGA